MTLRFSAPVHDMREVGRKGSRRLELSYSGLGYSAWKTGPTLPDVSRLNRVGELPLPLVRIGSGPSTLLAGGLARVLSAGLVAADVDAGRVATGNRLDGRLSLGVGPFVVLGLGFPEGDARAMMAIVGAVRGQGARVVGGRGAPALDQLRRGVARVV